MIQNNQRQVRVALASLERFVSKARRELRLPSGSFGVSLVTAPRIALWNRAYRGKPRPTDVLSFPFDSSNGQLAVRARSGAYLGDIAICPAVARRNAVQFRRTLQQEMCILLLHGLLHLLGYDHETDTGQMERCEKRLRKKLGIA